MLAMRNQKLKLPSRLTVEEKLAAIGVMTSTRALTARDVESVDIEGVLVDAIVSIGRQENQRLLSLLLTWVSIHGSAVIIEKLMKILRRQSSAGDPVHYAALLAKYAVSVGHMRWGILTKFAPTRSILIGPSDLAESLLKIRGEEEWASNSGFAVPKGSTTINPKWVISPNSLAQLNQQYKNRLIYGAQWRADIITAIERGAKTPTEISRMCGASYEPCHRVLSELKDAGILEGLEKRMRRAI